MRFVIKYGSFLFIGLLIMENSLFTITSKNESTNFETELNSSIANILLETKKYDELERLSKKALNKDKNSLSANYYLFIVNSIKKNENNTKKYLDDFEKLFKSKATVLGTPETGLMILLDKPETDVVSGKTVYLDSGNTEQFNYIPIYYSLASRYLETKDCRNALYWLNAAKYPTNNDEYYLGFQAFCNYQMKRYEVSRNYYKLFLEISENKAVAMYSIAASYAKEKNVEQTIKWLKDAFKKDKSLYNELITDKDNDFSDVRNTDEFKKYLYELEVENNSIK
ncbi:MAG: hypothetical protein OEV78_08065 [Spirochaetia bacterium]|nr:hypothetical protein [Spirochaetia bacterium]